MYTCTFQCLRPCLDRSGAGLAIHFLLECVFTTPSDECSCSTPTLQPLFMSAVAEFFIWKRCVYTLCDKMSLIRNGNGVCVYVSMYEKRKLFSPNQRGCECQCTHVSMQLNVIQRMIPSLYIPTLHPSNCIQATAHNIDQCVWLDGYWWIWSLISNDVLNFYFIYILVSRKLGMKTQCVCECVCVKYRRIGTSFCVSARCKRWCTKPSCHVA